MTGRTDAGAIVARLDTLLAATGLPDALAGQARRLHARLTSEVRIAVVGPPRSGKSCLREMLTAYAGLSAGGALPRLQGVAFIEPAGGPAIEDRRRALEQALTGADILLWCTQDFDDQEQALWRLVPEERKDHAFLVLTKADALYHDGLLSDRFAALEEAVADDFLGLFPLATPQALGALAGVRSGQGDPDMDLLTSSGAAALIGALGTHVAGGRRADVDNALLFLRRHADLAAGAEAARPAPAKEATAKAAPEAAASRPASPPPPPPPSPSSPSPSSPSSSSLAPASSPPTPDTDEDALGLLAEAEDRLRACGEDLLNATGGADGESADYPAILHRCAGTLEGLSAKIIELEVNGGHLASWHEEILQASEMMILLRLEDGRGPAEDAVTLMLQLRRELATRMAA